MTLEKAIPGGSGLNNQMQEEITISSEDESDSPLEQNPPM